MTSIDDLPSVKSLQHQALDNKEAIIVGEIKLAVARGDNMIWVDKSLITGDIRKKLKAKGLTIMHWSTERNLDKIYW